MTVAIRASRLLLLAVLASLGACGKAPERTEDKRTVMVHIATAAPSSGMQLTGEVRARHEVELAFRVGGK
ncbi:MAG TPA: efflux transporter periplasmic adaptor subunit, partial [Azonexus sp.]|nr:efflux transporter periplasmic adaptor subunit [Azonexus sp.]